MLCTVLVLYTVPAISKDSSTETTETAGAIPREGILLTRPGGATLTAMPIGRDLPRMNMSEALAGTTVVLEENFDNLPNEGVIPDGWQVFDEDGDGDTWMLSSSESYEGDNCMVSVLWAGGPADNWLVTESVSIDPGGREFSFYARHAGNEQHFEVWFCEVGFLPALFTTLGELVATDTTSEEWTLHSYWVDPDNIWPISGYLAIRCISSEGMFMFVDSVNIPHDDDPYVGFEGPVMFPPHYWSQEQPIPMSTALWSLSDGTGTQPAGVTPHSGEYMAQYNSWNATIPQEQARLRTGQLNFEGYDNLYMLHFWMYHDDNLPAADDKLKIQVSTDGASWSSTLTFYRYSPTNEWKKHSVYLNELAGEEVVYIGFLAESGFGNGIYIDDITITREATQLVCVMEEAEGTIASYLSSGIESGDGVFTYFDPEEECGSPYPFELARFRTSFMDPGGYSWPVEFDVAIYEPNDYWSNCDEPWTELSRYSFVADEAHFSYPSISYVDFPEPCCINNPVYIGIIYTNVTGPNTPGIIFDDGVGMDICDNWFYIEGAPDEFQSWDPFVGYPYFGVIGLVKGEECETETFHFEDGLTTYPHPDSNVSWHQIWPDDAYCTSWHQDGIAGDTAGYLDPTDTVKLSLLPDRSTKKWVHILDTRHMIKFYDGAYWDTMYAEYRGPAADSPYWESPNLIVGRYWSIIWPYDFHTKIVKAISFDDGNSNGVLDAGDDITLHDRYGDNHYAYVKDVYTGIVVEEVPLPYFCGDADASGGVDIDDVVFLIAYIFSGGPEPFPYENGDADCSGGIDIDDVVYLISYIFAGGPAPCDPNGDGDQDC